MRIPSRLFSASLSWLVAGTNTRAKHSFASIDTNKSSIPALFMLIVGVSGLGLSQKVLSDVSGTVYRDLPVNGSSINQYGIKEANELGEAGITVTVFDSSGSVVGSSVTTAQDGTWSVTGTSGNVRVEFSGIPSYLASSPVNTGSNTTVQFVADGATTVDLGLHQPADYSDTAVPEVVLSSWVGGQASAAGANNASLYSFPFDRNGQNEDDTFTDDPNGTNKVPAPTIDAIASETGATWGLAYQKNQKRYFASSVVRRHTGMADGTGFIYVIDKSAASASVAHKFDLNNIVTINGGTIDLGSVCRGGGCESDAGNTNIEADYLLANNISSPSVDLDAMKKVGKVAFGDIDMQPQTNYLWAVNLNQKALIKINVGDDNATNLPVLVAGMPDVDQFLISVLPGVPVCNNGEIRPWGLNFSNGKGYLGIACDAENSGSVSDLMGFVVSFNPNDVAAGFVEEIRFPLGFTRKGNDAKYTFAPWSHDWNDFRHMFSSRYTLPQAIVSDIEFDKAGNMNIALIDRAGMQLGTSNYKPISGVPISGNPGNVNDLVQNQTRGDLFHACKTVAGYEMEGSGSCPIHFPSDQGFQQTGEFFEESAGDSDREGALGALAILKGSDKIVMTILDPHPTGDVGRPYWTSQGVNFVHPESGAIEQYYTLYKSSSIHEFGKASGIGDVELLTAPAPLEIGNRVWEDADGDGLQGADENPISGVEVKLYENNVLVGSVNTSASGEYYFGGIGDTNMSRGETLKPLTAYEIRIVLNYAALTGMIATQQNVNTNANDSYDSDGDNGILNSGFSTIAHTTGNAGVNDHTLDFGFVATVAIGNKVWIDNGAGIGTANNGIKDGTESGVDNVKVELHKQSDDSLVTSTTTNGTGHYQFDNQLPGNYYIKIPATEFGSGKPLANLLSSTGVGTGDADENVDENGIDDATPASNGIRSAAYTLSAGGEPSGEATQSAYTGSLSDNSVNMTADFGFVPLVAIGNKVWIDNGAGSGTANNGIKDGTESGVDNVKVELHKQSDDSLVTSATTNGTGHYQFDNQLPGNYYIKIPATEFGSGKPLANLLSSTGAGSGDADETVDENGIDNADPASNGIRSAAYTLSIGGEPTGESTQSAYTGTLSDNSVNMTADFGFVTVGMSLGDFIWWDVDGNGTQGGTGETGVQSVKVELFAANGSTPAKDLDGNNVPFQTTGTDGLYLFTNLQADDYVVQITPPTGYQLTTGGADPDDDSNTDSNGYVTGAGKIQSHPVTLSVNGEPDNDGDSDKNSNLSVDFGLLKFDLALRKKVASVSDTPLIPGTSTVTFEIEVFNQGNIAASGIQIIDYIRTGFSYDSADNTAAATGNANDWSSTANPTLIIPGPIAAGASATVKIVLSVDTNTHNQTLTNAAEIIDDGSNTDIDSMPDSTDGNDVTVDDEIDNTGGDQDDHDIASIQVETFDMALRKKVDSQSHPVLIPGVSSVTFAIEVFNQGDVNASDVHIVDYITAGFTYDAAANTAALTGNTHDWSAGADPDLLIDTINAGQSQIVKIVLGIDTGTIGQTLDNFAEIADDGETAGTDIDSTPDTSNSENPVKDDVITEDGKNNAVDDEDDHDVAMVTVEGFDLALRKKIGTLSDDPLIAGSSQVTFTIEVINQGDVEASDITLVDYIQTGFSYDPAANTATNTGNINNWSASADPLLVVPGPIAAGASTTVKIILDVKAEAAGQTITNVAEIADDNQFSGTDVDSTPDSNNTEDPVKDDVVNEDGKNISGDDEDDHDLAEVTVPGARVAIGNTVWIDDGAGSGIENNGIKDGSEAGVNGVVVELRKQSDNSLVNSTTTNPAGHYQFDEQLPGTYYVKIPASQFGSGQLLENRQSSTGAGIGNSDEDSDENGIDNADPVTNGIRSMAYTLSVGGEPTAEITQSAYTGNLLDDSVNMTVDFGFYTAPTVHIGNLVWIEDDNNGDATDGVITFPTVGTIVTATASDGNTTYTGTTDANGLYDIEVPANDSYVVTVANPSGTVPTAGSSDNAVPDETAENNLSHDGSGTTVVVGTMDNFTLDFGFTPPPVPNVHIGNLVWIEDDNNGNATDGVIAFPPSGTIVTATSSDGQTTYTGITDASGLYDIEVPANDTYVVTVATPAGTVPTAGSSDNTVPDETAENNLTHDGSGTTVVVTTIDNFTLDFGFTTQSNAGVTGVVWFDTDKDGVKDPGENGLPGWTIEIIDSNGVPVQSLITLPDGTFSDLNLGTGDFTIRFLSSGGIIIKEQTITLNPGDVAFVPEPIDPAGIVYDEQTGAPIPGAQVFLTNNGTPLPAACLGAGEQGQVTGVDGAYNFFLNPGADPACPATDTVYGIQVVPPTNYQASVDNPPQAGVLDSDNCTIDAVAGITCEVSDQTVTPIAGIPPYFIEVEIGVGDPGVFNNHIPLTPPSVVAPPPTPSTPVKPIPTLSEWGRIILMLLIGVAVLMQQGWRRKEVAKF